MAASIIDYFNSKPKGLGISTLQTYETNGSNLMTAADLTDYKVLMNSCDATSNGSVFESLFANGKNGKYPSLLMHAADIYWGDAQFRDSAALSHLANISLYHDNRIRTSRDIIAILEYILAHLNDGPGLLFSLDQTALSWTGNSATAKSIRAIATNGDATQTTWKIEGDFTMNPASGKAETVTVTPKTTANAASLPAYTEAQQAKGTISANVASLACTNNSHTITASFAQKTTSVTDTKNYSGNVTGENSGQSASCSLSVTFTDTQQVAGQAAGTYNWTTESFPTGVAVSGTNAASFTISNTTAADIIFGAGAKIKVSNSNASNTLEIPVTGTLTKQVEQKTYYYYIGNSEPFMKNIYQDEDFKWHYDHKDGDLGEILKGLSDAKKSSRLIAGADSDVYAQKEQIKNPSSSTLGNGKTWYCCAIGPKEWYEWAKTGVQNDVLPGSSVSMKQGIKEFKIGEDDYVIGVSGQLSLTIRLSVK